MAYLAVRYAPTNGPLALDPRAFGAMVPTAVHKPTNETRDGVVIVTARGPLEHHEGSGFDSYDAIRGRVVDALAAKPKAVVLSIDSPGGLVSGFLETARGIRDLCAAARVPLHAHVNGCATSAAYALACAASTITTPDEGVLGSIGVIDMLPDATRADAAMGMNFAVIFSGERKGDSNPHVPNSDAAIAAAQARVDSLAEAFFAFVAESRSLSVPQVRALEAGLLHGAHAVAAGLADRIATLDQVLASLQAPSASANTNSSAGVTTMNEEEKKALLASLRKAAEGGDEKAKKALAAFEDEPSDDDKKKEEEAKAKAAADEEQKRKDEEEAKAKATADAKAKADAEQDPKALALRAYTETQELRAELAREKETVERDKLLATRPDLPKEIRALLQSEPLAKVRAYIDALPKTQRPAASAELDAPITRGAGQVDKGQPGAADQVPEHVAKAMDQAFGLTTVENTSGYHEGKLVLSVVGKAK